MDMTIEICCDDLEKALAAEKAGADRVELCRDLTVGGLTPPRDVIRAAVAALEIPVNVLIRPRGGSFVYSPEEAGQILNDIIFCGNLREEGRRVNGVVFGALLPDGAVDITFCRQMAESARTLGLSTTFHRAIDESADIMKALDAIIDLGGIDRILTSGAASDAYSGRRRIEEMVKAAEGRLSIMAGCGVTAGNAAEIVRTTGVREIHGSRPEIIKALRG